jgi:hypothetical protein
MTTKEEKEPLQEPFLARWSRLKQETKEQPPQKAPEKAVDPKAPPPVLPSLDKLTFDSDFRGFFHPKVDEDLRRAALRKLFSDPHFNVMDGLDVYIDDYSKSEPIPAAMLAQLKQAQKILEWAKGDEREEKGARGDRPAGTAKTAALEDQAPAAVPASPLAEKPAQNQPSGEDEPQPRRTSG